MVRPFLMFDCYRIHPVWTAMKFKRACYSSVKRLTENLFEENLTQESVNEYVNQWPPLPKSATYP